ncbi:acetolactate synthase [Aspergillus coremiiformis]|uniref:Acetolactate synthase n=1 Tax=Aspergillus coremiiformis TaxID=138285 RepID=A0A5N6Z776_9EURO|nr:acetolactate synthase [Aspergillus coremiiformis]
MSSNTKKDSLLGYSGGEILRNLLATYGVDHIFGYTGGAALPLFDAMYKTSLFRLIVSRHEQGAGHMAEGYARASGKPGVVLVTSGPGMSNVVTPMLDALLDGTPMVVICGQVATTVQGTGAFQEIDITALARPCTKWCTCVETVASLPAAIHSAFKHATDKRPGPVLVAIPKDVGAAVYDARAFKESFKLLEARSISQNPRPSRTHYVGDLCKQVDRVAKLINQSQRPVICAGNGVHSSELGPALLIQVAERAGIPVATTLLGLGSFDETHDLSLHLMGTYGTPYANYAVQNADMIIVIGARLDERATGKATDFAPEARDIVQLDINPETVGKVIQPTDLIVGDLSGTLSMLLPKLAPVYRKKWLAQIQHWKAEHSLSIPPTPGQQQCAIPQQVIAELNRQTDAIKHRTIITTGVGQHQMWVAQRYRWRHSRSLITSGSLGTMGYGLPAAIGAQIAKPDHVVIDVDGDASFSMTMEELMTASEHQIPVKAIIFNNGRQAMVTQLQLADYHGRVCYSQQKNPDFVALAHSMWCQARQCRSLDTLAACIQWLLDCQGPAVLDVIIADVDFKPLVPSGGSLDQIQLE